MQHNRICYVTEVDLDEMGGAITNDKKTIDCLRKLGDVDVIYLQRRRRKSMIAALLFTLFTFLKVYQNNTTYIFLED